MVIVLGLVCTVLQGTVFRSLGPLALVIPNFALMLVVFLAFYEVSAFGALLAFIVGLELDLFSGVFIGPWAGSCVAVYGFLSALAQHLFIESVLAASIVVFLSALGMNLVYMILVFEFKPIEFPIFWRVLGDSFVTALVAPAVFWLLRRFAQRFGDLKRDRNTGRFST